MNKNMMNRKEKEEYLIKMLQEEGLLKYEVAFRKKLRKISDELLNIKIESMELYLDNTEDQD